MLKNAAYKTLRELGMRPAIARHFIAGLRRKGFVLVEGNKVATVDKIKRQVEIIIKLMKAGRSI